HNKAAIEEQAKATEEIITELPVRVSRVNRLPIDNQLRLTGTFEARKSLDIIAEGQGRITHLYIEEGQSIRKDQAVAKIDDTNLQAQLNTAIAARNKAETDVARFERLLQAGAVSQQQYEEVALNLQNVQANVTTIEQQLKYTTARSPMAGIVESVKVEEGSFATPGAPIATVVDVNRLIMVVTVGETDIIKIREGQEVSIQTEVYPQKTFFGNVSLVGVQADAGRKYQVEIELPNPTDTPLKPGMYGEVVITPQTDREATALFIPRKAIVGSVQEPVVYVVLDDHTVRQQAVEIETVNQDQVRVLSGLSVGDLVVTSGQINLSDGKMINIINQEELAAQTPASANAPSVQ
ncbi:MAG: efflux RND transporter periplasmic adaptor subunit, partial [Lewinella sp.]|nr:efflux RND transporter periplasmic adaptor subunit [Lewinella sp.]